jgi:hypothetical protein
MTDLSDRHPSTQQVAQWFSFDHLPPGDLQATSADCAALADKMIGSLPDSPELTTGLRKLLEAKDCFVRAALALDPTGRPG